MEYRIPFLILNFSFLCISICFGQRVTSFSIQAFGCTTSAGNVKMACIAGQSSLIELVDQHSNPRFRQGALQPGSKKKAAQNIIRELEIQAHPNPGIDKINISIPSEEIELCDFTLYTTMGEAIHTGQISLPGQLELDVAGYPSGIYIFECRGTRLFGIKKIMVTH